MNQFVVNLAITLQDRAPSSWCNVVGLEVRDPFGQGKQVNWSVPADALPWVISLLGLFGSVKLASSGVRTGLHSIELQYCTINERQNFASRMRYLLHASGLALDEAGQIMFQVFPDLSSDSTPQSGETDSWPRCTSYVDALIQ